MQSQRSSLPGVATDPGPPRSSALPREGVPADQPRFLSVTDTAELLGVSDVTLYRAIRAQRFPAIRLRKRYVVPTKVIDAMESAALSMNGVVDPADWVEGRGIA